MDEQENAFIKLKQEFSKNLKNYHPDYNKYFTLKTDATINIFAGEVIQIQKRLKYQFFLYSE